MLRRRSSARLSGKRSRATSNREHAFLLRRPLRVEALEPRRLLAAIPVNTTADLVNGGDAFTSLREAIIQANSMEGPDTITLDAGVYMLSIGGADENLAATGDLDIRDDLTIQAAPGESAATVIIDGGGLDRVFDVQTGTTQFNISNITIQNGSVTGNGGGLNVNISGVTATLSNLVFDQNTASGNGGGVNNNNGASVVIVNSVVSGNQAGQQGGGINNNSGGTIAITGSTITGNSAGFDGGGVNKNSGGSVTITESTLDGNMAGRNGGGANNNSSSQGELNIIRSTISNNETTGETESNDADGAGVHSFGNLNITNSTISGNISARNGGGIDTNGTVNIESSTLANNTAANAGGGVVGNFAGIVNVHNSIFADNTVQGADANFFVDAESSLLSQGYNLDTDGTGNLNGTGDLSNVDAMLGDLADNGGPTLTHALLTGSMAIDAGDPNNFEETDQRGVFRPQGLQSDIGAFELETPPIIVNTNVDLPDVNPEDGVCDIDLVTPGNQISLRAAIQCANMTPGPDTIIVPAGEYILAIIGLNEDEAASGDLDITDHLTIRAADGASADTVIIDAAQLDRVFHIVNDVRVNFSGLTIRNGVAYLDTEAGAAGGGGIYNAGTLTIEDSVISGNSARTEPDPFQNGLSGGNIELVEAAAAGGGIFSMGSMTIRGSEITDNEARGGDNMDDDDGDDGGDVLGGGIYQATSGGFLLIENSAITFNRATGGQGVDLGGEACGGGIFFEDFDGALTFSGLTLSENVAEGGAGQFGAEAFGGGIYIEAANMATIGDDSIINHNSAVGGAGVGGEEFINGFGGRGDGGAIYHETGTLAITSTFFEVNQAIGGEAMGGADSDAFAGDGRGGAIYTGFSTTTTIALSDFFENEATGGTATGGSGEGRDASAGQGLGGGIYNEGELQIVDSTLDANIAEGGDGNGGIGIDAEGSAAQGFGGGIYHALGGLQITGSTLSNNFAIGGSASATGGSTGFASEGIGGGLYGTGVVAITNSTFSGNRAIGGTGVDGETGQTTGESGVGGGLYLQGGGGVTSTLTNLTITNNLAIVPESALPAQARGGGVAFGGAPRPTDVLNTIIAGNDVQAPSGVDSSETAVDPDVSDDGESANSLGHNLIGVGEGSTAFVNGENGDIVGTEEEPVDPRLDPLDDNGGPTETHALLADSPAVDAAHPEDFPPTDQRGVFRPQGEGPDIGAFELSLVENQPPDLDPIADRNANVGQPVTFIATASDADGDDLVFSLDTAPSGATIDPVTGAFSWTPTPAQGGQTFEIIVRVTDDGEPALFDTETFSVTVQPLVEPQFTMSAINGPNVGVPGQLRSYFVTFSDTGTGETYTATIDWGDGTVNSGFVATSESGGNTTGVVSFWHTYTTIGDRTIELTLRDGQGNVQTAETDITVQLVTFQPDPLDPSRTALVAGGLDDMDDMISFNPQGGGINVMYRDYNHGQFSFDGSVIAFGQGGNDTITVNPSINRTAMLFGQAGNDQLFGGSGSNILVGGTGADLLIGSGVRDLLFGGLGADTLQGLGGDDLLASDFTVHEYDPALLAMMFHRWTSSDSYAERLHNLRFEEHPALNNTTVFNDFEVDQLTGGGGQDWFLFLASDLVTNPEAGEEGLGVPF